MRLLHARTIDFHEFDGLSIPAYAILSHRWEGGEVTYQDIKSGMPDAADRKGVDKVRQCCLQALRDKLDYVWIDTCCIDKSSSAELSEAINSMYQWYQRSVVCYAYFSDVQPKTTDEFDDAGRLWMMRNPFAASQFKNSKWWIRGWTLQELIAPQIVKFFAQGLHGWMEIGSKRSLLDLVAIRTGIDEETLRGRDVRDSSIAKRMSWASKRQTTRTEDIAYCLLGIFGVNMPLLYGEGNRAFLRLQEEIMKQSDDQTLFAWQLEEYTRTELCGPLATSPSQFQGSSHLVPIPDSESETPYSITNKGLRIELPIVQGTGRYGVAILQCSPLGVYHDQIALPIVCITQQESNYYARDGRHTGPLLRVSLDFAAQAVTKTILIRQAPEPSAGWRIGVLARIQTWQWNYYHPIYFDSSFVVSEGDTEGRDVYLISSRYRRGAILCAGLDGSYVMILFNIERGHLGQYACKVLYCPPPSRMHQRSNIYPTDNEYEVSPEQALVYKMVSNLKGTAQTVDNSLNYKPLNSILSGMRNRRRTFAYYLTSETPLLTLYNNLSTSHSRQSFDYLPNSNAVYAKIKQEVVRGEHMFALDIEFQDRSREQRAPHELPAIPISPHSVGSPYNIGSPHSIDSPRSVGASTEPQ